MATARPAGVTRETLRRYRYPLAVWALSRAGVYLVLRCRAGRRGIRAAAARSMSRAALAGRLGRGLVPLDRGARLRPLDRARQHRRVLPALPAGLVAPDLAARGRTRCGQPAQLAAAAPAALCLLYRITLGRYDEGMARRTVLYLAIFPLTFVFSLPYAESLFLLLVLGAFALTWYGRWWWGSLVGARAVVTRPVGIALFPALAWRRWRLGERRRRVPAAAAAAGRRAGFFGFLWWRTGDPLAHFHAQERGWGRGVSVLPVVSGRRLADACPAGTSATWCTSVHAALVLRDLWGWRMRLPGEYLIYAAADPAADHRRAARLGRQVRDGRLPHVLGAGRPWPRRTGGHRGQVFPLLLAALVFVTFGPRTFTP